ncbi:MAG: ATP-binding protein [Candidatus Desulfacyla sp.]
MEKQTCCINIKPIFDYLKAQNYTDWPSLVDGLNLGIDACDDPVSFLTDPNNWISTDIMVKLFERTRAILCDDMAAYRIARFAVENASLGYIQKIFVKAFWSSKKGFKHVQEINDKFNRSKKVELVEITGNSAIVRLHWDPTMVLSKDLCLYNQAFYSFLPTIWSGKPLSLEETHCYFEGKPYCEYHIKWDFQHRVREYFSRFFASRSMLKDIIAEQEKDKEIIERKYEEVDRLNVELKRRIEQLVAIQETGKAILSVLDLDHLLTVIMNILSNVCQINRAMIMLINTELGCLEYLYALGFEGDVPEQVKNYTVPLSRVSNILARVASTGQPEYVPRVDSSSLSKGNIILTHGNPRAVFIIPLITRSKVIGIIATDGVDGEEIPEETRNTMEVFAPQIAIAIENARLYSKLQEQMAELRRSHALLSRAEKFSFLGNLSARLAHEIKNPMTAIETFLQMLPQKYDDEEFRKDFHKIALEETKRVNGLITELLDLVKKRETHFQFNDLHDLIDKMILLVSPQSNAKKIEVVRRYSPDIGQVWLDPEKMKEVILNLLSNALEFTLEGGKIEITTRICKEIEKSRNICIEITDNGDGIPESMMETIFDPYFTTKHKSSIHKGTGLGLFIAHRNMLDHGGSIEAKSRVNEGTTFYLTLPSEPFQRPPVSQKRKNHANR